MKDKLLKKENDFCFFLCETGNKREAAIKAGYRINPEKSAAKLLSQEKINAQVKALTEKYKSIPSEVEAGYRRLAFGSVADAVKLIYTDEISDEQLETLDLFMLSDIKRPKGGGIEIKFFDRLKALEHLEIIGNEGENSSALQFYKALESSAENNG